jgi:Xaa-Pro aminopeptidase
MQSNEAQQGSAAAEPAEAVAAPPGEPETPGAEPETQGAEPETPGAEPAVPASRPHDPRTPPELVQFMSGQWAPRPAPAGPPHPATANFARRRAALSALFPGAHLVIPTGQAPVRSNDTEYRFRPGTDFYWLCGQMEPGGVLLLRAEEEGHRATLYIEPRADRSTPAFFTNARTGELWVGPRLGLEETGHRFGVDCAPLGRLQEDLAGLEGPVHVLRGFDDAVDGVIAAPEDAAEEQRLARDLSELRLVKDEHEVRMLERAVAATVKGFADVVRALPEAMEQGERVVEGVFNLRARVEGNDTGYETIAAAGSHATTLHWTRNDGQVRPGELLLLDAGVETEDLYTADVTRTLPVSGRFSPQQRRLYELVYRAQDAAIAAVRPGVAFLDPHRAAMKVLAEGLAEMGILPVSAEEALSEERQLYRRYTLHGTSHMLGLDVHDCAHAREEEYRGGTLTAGHVLTIEPGLYFQPDDLTVPEELRGIGIRIEDDVVVTEDGCRVLSEALPRHPDDIERWMAELRDGDLELRRSLS